MQISIETTTQSASLFTASFSNGGAEGQKNDPKGNAYVTRSASEMATTSPPPSMLWKQPANRPRKTRS